MKVIFELADVKYLLTPDQANEVLNLIYKYGAEVYEAKTNWSQKTETHHVYDATPAMAARLKLPVITDAVYGLGKVTGKPE
jgi:hypothetical protein